MKNISNRLPKSTEKRKMVSDGNSWFVENKKDLPIINYEDFSNSIKFMGKIINSKRVPFKDIENIIDLSKTLDVFSKDIIQNIVKRLILLEYFEDTKKEILRGLMI